MSHLDLRPRQVDGLVKQLDGVSQLTPEKQESNYRKEITETAGKQLGVGSVGLG